MKKEYNSRDRCIRSVVLVNGEVLLSTVAAQLADRDHWLVLLLHLGSIYFTLITTKQSTLFSHLDTPMTQIKHWPQQVILHKINREMVSMFSVMYR